MNEGDTDLFGPLELEPDDDNMDESIREIEKLEKRMEEYQKRLESVEDEIRFLNMDNRYHGDVESRILKIIDKLSIVVSTSVIFIIGMAIMNVIQAK